MKFTRKLLCLLLALALVMTLTPAVARAQEATPEAEPVWVELPFRVNPLYEGLITEADLDIPEFPEIDPNQARPNASSYQTMEKAGAQVRQYMKGRNGVFTVYVKTEADNFQDACDLVFAEALKHNGTATEGDYIMWQYGGYRSSGYMGFNSSTGLYEYDITFTVPYYTTAAQEKEMDTAVANLLKSLNLSGKSDYDKIYGVYDWLCRNVTYDYANLNDTSYMLKHTAYAALIDRTAVCQGYAVLFYRLMLELDVDARVIVGDGGGPHAWNIVELDDLYYNLDSTWDAGSYNYVWFLNSYWDFGGHERELEYDTIAFHNEYPLAAESYEPGKTATMDPYICAGYCGTADTEHTNAEWWLGRDGSLTIRGSGSTYNYNTSNQQPYFKYWETEITTLVVEEGITGLGTYMFNNFPGMEEIYFLGNAPTIANTTFNGVRATAYYPAGNSTWTKDKLQNYGGSLTWKSFSQATEVASGWSGNTQWTLTSDGVLTVYGKGNMKNYGYNGGQPWLNKGVDITSVVIEEGVTAIGTGAFRNLTTLESVTLPEKGLTKIGEAAFYGCTSLKEIEIPETIYTVWLYTFKNCTALEEVKLPKSLIKVDQGAFENCTSLPYIYFPTNVEIIGSWSFKGCTGLVEADMTWTDATKIREGAFKNCSALTTIHLPVNIQTLGDSCFYGIGATTFTVPDTVTSIEAWCFARAYSLKNIYFEGNAPTIGQGAFNKITLTAFYPKNNTTWKSDIMQNYGGTVTWKAN